MSRIPIRLRLTLPFAFAMAIVLAGMGVFVYVRVGDTLLGSIDQNLRAQLVEVETHATRGGPLIDTDASVGPTIAFVQLADGTVVQPTTNGIGPVHWPRPTRVVRRTADVPGVRGDWRLIEAPVTANGQPATLVIGRSLGPREETLHRLFRAFLYAAPLALLLAVLSGYALAAAALRPVEAMRRRAAAVSADEPGRRLPVPPARDEISALALTLNDMLARLEASFEHERRFLADASHELRTPLALLRGELELALRRPRSHDELEAAVRSAAEETERLTRLAEDLLLIARSDQGKLPIRAERTTANELLEQVRGRFSLLAADTGRRLVVEPDGAIPLEADPARVEQALGNLVANAFEHGGGDVTLFARDVDGRVELHVTDHGAGLPPAFIERAFDRFSRADTARGGGGGTGLGLAIVELIARAHGGRARVANRDGGGTDAWIELPARS